MQNKEAEAKAFIEGINNWSIQSIVESKVDDDAWQVVITSAPRIVGDLLPNYSQGSDEGIILPLEARDGTVEYDETVLLRRNPNPDQDEVGIVMWGHLTCPYESSDRGTFFGTIAFYTEDEEGDALVTIAEIEQSRFLVAKALDEVDNAIHMLEGHGAHVVEHAERILSQMASLNAILKTGMAIRKLAE